MRIDPKSSTPVSDEGAPVQDGKPASKPSTPECGNVIEGWKPAGGACMNAPTGQSRAPADLSCMIGDVGYYRARYDDFVQRHPGQKPPYYYLEYGEKYARRFTQETSGKLSPEGQRWLKDTFELLQARMEHLRVTDPVAFEKLERDPEAFKKFAYETHSDAYLDAGLRKLGAEDLGRIVTTPDRDDLLSEDGIKQGLITGGKLILQKAVDAMPTAEQQWPQVPLRLPKAQGGEE